MSIDKRAWYACAQRACLRDGDTLKRPLVGRECCSKHKAPFIYVGAFLLEAQAHAHLRKIKPKDWQRLTKMTEL